jgi:phospholipid/cholesterol/gamma-HCH transport system permease protein
MSFSVRHESGPEGSLAVTVLAPPPQGAAGDAIKDLRRSLVTLEGGRAVVISGSVDMEVDSLLLSWLFGVARVCNERGLTLSFSTMPEQVQRQLALALSVPERKGARREHVEDSLLMTVGKATIHLLEDLQAWLAFIGELVVAVVSFVCRRARVPVRDIWGTIDECGPGALPIVTLISTLVGVILAFIGAQQLQQFGAQIYVANLVSVAMLREMGAVMAGVIMAGRTGAAFAAQLGTMQVNEEIDALKTLGISPMQYLVVPRVVALIVMMPLLCLYADLLGIVGGAVVSSLTMDISLVQFFNQAATAVHLSDFWLGVSKSCIFGVLIAIAGCLSGIRCGRSASAVGTAVTSAVVSGIVAIVLCDAVFAIFAQVLGL